ncbi:DUF1127 domain-containing protein [Bradyrhizobium sp. th.b2]|uniref:DUF1127 domain-containing protein n=1 Tax=Bradyrhizobium sp. th-b2 TaxID=172088 RepID=UPI000A025C94|nr:DUF1127 domain-containing protein [Bradyrhizobium sp. th.b2]
MPCGSTINNSTNTLDAASASFPAFRGSWRIPTAWLAGLALWLERQRQYRELLELDDWLLTDIGVSKADVEEVRKSPLYLNAWRDSR